VSVTEPDWLRRPMKRRQLLTFASVIGLGGHVWSQPQGKGPPECTYNAAFYDGSPLGVSPELVVLGCDGRVSSIPLPLALGTAAFGPDGKSLYGTTAFNPVNPGKPGIFKTEFSPARVSLVAGSTELGVASLAITASNEKVVVSGNYRHQGKTERGIFELEIATQTVKALIPDDSPAGPRSGWRGLSLSPDGVEAAAVRNRRLEIVNLREGAIRSVKEGFAYGAWSPDGKWIAAIDRQQRTLLLDPSGLQETRDLGPTGGTVVAWSPDSRYLLLWKEDRCGVYSESYGTLERVDLSTGKRSTVAGSACRIRQFTFGWVRPEILK
jgi:hypothetical protein